MWTRVKKFLHACCPTRREVAGVSDQIFAVAAKLTALQTRQRIIEASMCALDDIVTGIRVERAPGRARASAEIAAARVRKDLQARGVIPVVPEIAEGDKISMKPEYVTGPSLDMEKETK